MEKLVASLSRIYNRHAGSGAIGVDMPNVLSKKTLNAWRDQYVDHLVVEGSSMSLLELRARSVPGAIYRARDRGGLDVVAIPEKGLSEHDLDVLSRFRFAQYLAAGFIDKDVAFKERLDHDSLTHTATPGSAGRVHFIVFEHDSGRLLASMCLLPLPSVRTGMRMRDRERPLFPVEEHFGWGVFNRLALIPDTPVARVREFGRLVKNARHGSIESGARSIAELFVAAYRTLVGPLAMDVDVCVGESESTRAIRGLQFMHTPMIVLEGGLPVFARRHPLNPALDGRDRYPFAFLISDGSSMASRVDAVEAALALPDEKCGAQLAALKGVTYDSPCALIPAEGVPALANTPLEQRSLSLTARRRARSRGCRLRRFPVFAGLSDTECTTLRMLGTEEDVEPGRTILQRDHVADEFVFIGTGHAELRMPGRPSETIAGPGDCIGAAGVLAGVIARGDVTALTRMRLLRFPADICLPLLRELPDVELSLHRLALRDPMLGGGDRVS